jgi:hypothetical protein
MDFQARITPIIASLEDSLGLCVEALNGGGDVALVANTLTTVQQALSKLRTVIDGLAAIENEQSLALFGINDAAIELLLSLDATQPSYKPRPHLENVDLIHAILEYFPESPPPQKTLPPEFNEAMHKHMDLVAQYGETSPQAKRSLMEAMHLAPDWFMDDISKMGNEMDLLPPSSGYLEDGSPMFSLNDIAAKFGIPIEQAEQDLKEMLSVRQDLGLPLDGVTTDSSLIHRKQ